MKKSTKFALFVTAAVIIPSPAFAYIDPAMGSMLFQGVIGAIAIAGTAWYTLRQKVTDLIANAKAALQARGARAK